MPAIEDKSNLGVIVTVGVVGAVGVLVVSMVVTAMVRSEVGALADERNTTADLRTVRELEQSQTTALAKTEWVDKAAGEVAIPIDQAMNLVVRDLKNDPSSATPAGPAPVTADAGAEAPDGGGTGAP